MPWLFETPTVPTDTVLAALRGEEGSERFADTQSEARRRAEGRKLEAKRREQVPSRWAKWARDHRHLHHV
jgi:hypothetical protein